MVDKQSTRKAEQAPTPAHQSDELSHVEIGGQKVEMRRISEPVEATGVVVTTVISADGRKVKFKTSARQGSNADVNNLRKSIRSDSIKRIGMEKIQSFREIAEDELKKLGAPAQFAISLEEVLQQFDRNATCPPIDSKLRPHMPRLLARAAAVAFQQATEKANSTDATPQASSTPSIPNEQSVLRAIAKATAKPALSPLGRYVDHAHEYPSAEEFLREAYKGRLGIENGDLNQSTLKKLDFELIEQLAREFRGKRAPELRKLIPTVREFNNALLIDALGYVPKDLKERDNALTTLRRGERPGIRKSSPKWRTPT
jgi:hypothetical protein